MESDCEYRIAYAACIVHCVTNKVDSVQELEEEVWPLLQGHIYVPRDVFRFAAGVVLQELDAKKKSLVLDNEECAILLARARSSSAS